MFLVDTSAWIRHFNSRDEFDMRDVCAPDERVLCLPVYQEILQGVRDDRAYRRMKDALDAAPMIDDPMDRELVVQAVALYRRGRRRGVTVRSSIDCLVAASAVRHGLTVLHADRDFPALARVSDLQERAIP
jgi:hypothetical protein